MNIIDQLKKNRYPFGMWTEPECYGPELGKEMQEKAGKIDAVGMFVVWFFGKWKERVNVIVFNNDLAYRLRPDYAEEPEIEERLIMPAGAGLVCCSSIVGTENLLLSECVNHPDFIGFKFKGGTVAAEPIRCFIIGTKPRGYCVSYDEIKTQQDFMHATHALFRKEQNNENRSDTVPKT